MKLRLTRLLVIGTLAISLGTHWALLQTAAWLGMLYTYTQQAGVSRGIAMTFDGEHPCALCKAIQEGKTAEREQPNELTSPSNDLKLDLPPTNLVLHHPPFLTPAGCRPGLESKWDHPPELPPPRQA